MNKCFYVQKEVVGLKKAPQSGQRLCQQPRRHLINSAKQPTSFYFGLCVRRCMKQNHGILEFLWGEEETLGNLSTRQVVLNGSYCIAITGVRIVFLKTHLCKHGRNYIQLVSGYSLQRIYSRPNGSMVGWLNMCALVSDPGSNPYSVPLTSYVSLHTLLQLCLSFVINGSGC